MDKNYDHNKYESEIYSMWEKGGYFQANIDKGKKPYTVVLPPPNASGKMHIGNVLMIAIEDLLIRWKRMQGYETLWIPGTDHAGFETQITYERHLKKEGKSRFDYDRQTLYENIWNFVQVNKGQIEKQIRDMGASVDWSRYTFTLDGKVIDTVYETFEKMYRDGLVYRADYLVNYCIHHGTTLSELEINHEERNTPLYYIKYKLVDRKNNEPEHVSVATTRPEPIFVDTHLAVNPNDKKNKWLVGRTVLNPLTNTQMEIIADDFVDPKFGTGIVKLTPAHDKNDYEVAKKHKLPINLAFGLDGKMVHSGGKLAGLYLTKAREKAIEILQDKKLVEKIDDKYTNSVSVCYKCGNVIEPIVIPNWFVKVDDLKKPALDAVKSGEVKIYPKWQERKYINWMKEMHDWPISRQIVWGIRIPVWYNIESHENRVSVSFINKNNEQAVGTVDQLIKNKGYTIKEIKEGLQQINIPIYESDSYNPTFVISKDEPNMPGVWFPETDTFDTWFSSGQWPLVTLGYPDSKDFNFFYPTSVLETGWEILRFWVSRMIMFGYYLTEKAPFNDVYLHGLVRATDGRKMSKSLGNVINPDEYLTKYGADALRMGLISATAVGKDFNFPHDKVLAFQRFGNKIWNMARFMKIMFEQFDSKVPFYTDKMKTKLTEEDKMILKGLDKTIMKVDHSLARFRFSDAADAIYHYMWDELASNYIEKVKDRKDKVIALAVLRHCYINSIKLLHPFMPFVTEAIWPQIPGIFNKPFKRDPLIISSWPSVKN